jgi:two-component system alkaline phosphatase synthesis response regulator PhoP
MASICIVSGESWAVAELCSELTELGFRCSITPDDEAKTEWVARQFPDLLLIEMDGHIPNSKTWELIQRMKQESSLPIIALVARETLDGIDGHLDVDDFLTSPYDARELGLRAKRLLHKTKIMDSGELIKCDGLVIDLAKCEVTIDGKVVELTFKEYQLLKFLASNKGHVYTREALLNRVWGYDYYGGDRTVDVHVRRLRSKIEDSKHNFIETVRNMGYRFKKDV